MDKLKEIRELLEKFYEGATSREEEIRLRKFFRSATNLSADFQADKELFNSMDSLDQEVNIPPDLDEKISSALDNAQHAESRLRRISFYSLSGLAAGLLIILSVYLGYIRENQSVDLLAQYTVNDPEKAYIEARKALGIISDKWNSGTNQLESLKEVNRGIESISTIRKISSGSRELNLLGNLKKAENIEIQ